MSYAQLVLCYLMATIVWLLFTELWSKRAAMILWWTLVSNSAKDIIAQNFNQWSKRLMKTAASTPKDRERALAYYAARDFVHLDFQQKYDTGFALGLCDHFDAIREEENLEEYIFEKVIRDKVLDEFIATVRRIKYDNK